MRAECCKPSPDRQGREDDVTRSLWQLSPRSHGDAEDECENDE